MRAICPVIPLLLILLCTTQSYAQQGKDGNVTIAGNQVVNEYAQVTGGSTAGSTTLNVNNSSLNNNGRFSGPLEPGDLVMIIQMQGASITGNTNDASAWGAVTNYNGAGSYEIKEVKSVPNGNSIEFECGLENTYSVSGNVQVVRIPRIDNLTLNGGATITSSDWNGTTGGIVALDVAGTLTLNAGATIDVTGQGFRGGQIENQSSADAAALYNNPAYATADLGAEKGESIAGWGPEYDALGGRYGLGAPANGGGGGGAHNAGGGGGSNAGIEANWTGTGVPNPAYNAAWALENPSIAGSNSSGGGRGGYAFSWNAQDPLAVGPSNGAWGFGPRNNVGGLGGRPLDYATQERLFFGGGGGAGDGNDGGSNGGGDGAGIVYITGAGSITGSGTIVADGDPGESTTGYGNDAPGGAGGGGAVKIELQGSVDGIGINARGGRGGDQYIEASTAGKGYNNGAEEGEGPGGGGGGGYISVSAGSASTDASGGSNGVTDESNFATFPPNGATSGNVGTAEVATTWDFTTTDDEVCEGETATVTVSTTGTPATPQTFEWFDAEVGGNLLHTGNSFTTGPLTSDTTFWVGPCPGTYRKPANVVVNELPDTTLVDAEICADATATLTTTAGMQSYAWSTGDIGVSINSNTTGTYTVTLTNADGCTAVDDVDLVVNPLPTFTLNDQTGCPPLNVTFTGPAGMADYDWSTGAATQSINVTTATTVSLTITDNEGCVAQDNATATEAASLNPSLADASVCDGGSHTFNPGTFDNYLWSDNSTDPTLTATTTGNYAVTVTSNDGCTGTADADLTVNTNPTVTINDATICDNETQTITSSATFDQYLWSSGQNTSAIAVNTAGNYTLSVTDGNGCTAQDDMTLTVNTSPTFTLTDGTVCTGQEYTQDGPGSMTTYAWSSGESTRGITVTAANTYTLTVTDGNGCFGQNDFTLNLNPLPNPTMANQDICDGASATFTPGAYAGYNWNTGLGVATLTTSTAGTYTVTVTDNNGCENAVSATLTVNPLPNPALADDAICDDETTTINPGAGFDTYTWSTGANTSAITINTADTYAVTVATAAGCEAQATMDLTVNPAPTITVDDGEICDGETFTVTGPAGYTTYLWSNGSPNPSFDWGASGSFTLTVTDANGCTGSDDMTLTVNPLPTPTLADQAVCDGEDFGFAPGAYASFQWFDGASTQVYTASNTGNYGVTVTDAEGCSASTDANLTVNPNPDITLTDMSHCTGDQSTITPGAGFASYDWNTGDNTASITRSDAGTYAVTVTDNNGCTDSDDMTLTVNTMVTFDMPDAAVCAGESYTIQGPSNMGSYLWSTGDVTSAISVSLANTYSLSVTSQSGCPGQDDMTLTLNPLPTPTLVDGDICQGEDYTFDAGAFAAYLWSDGSFSQTFVVSTSGDYGVTVTDNNGCQGSTSGNLIVRNNPIITMADAQICPEGNADFTPGAGFANYAWSNGGATASVNVNAIDTYAVTVTDANGCEGTTSADLTHFTSPLPTVDNGTICADGQFTLMVNETFVDYAWSNGAQTANNTTNTAGLYEVTVTDNNGCIGTTSATLTVNPLPVVTTSTDTLVCGGDSLQILADGGIAYAWSPAASLETPDQATSWAKPYTPTTYTVTVTDANGCENTGTVDVALAPGGITFGPDQIVCPGESTILSAAGGVGYNWEPAAQVDATDPENVIATADTPTDFIVTVTDINGCFQIDTIFVDTHPEPAPELRDTAICIGQSVSITPGDFNLYLWEGGIQSAAITISDAGNYSVTVANEFGCTNSTDMDLSLYSLPTVLLTPDDSICPGESSTLIASGGTEYVWAADPSLADNIGALVVATPTASTTYTVSVTDANGCRNTGTVNVIMETQSVAAIIPAGPYCPDDIPVVLQSTEPDGTWYGTGILNPEQGIFSPQIAGTGIHVISYAINSSCPDSTSIDIVVEGMTDPEITPVGPFCLDADAVDIEAATADGTWEGPGITDATTGMFSPMDAGPGLHEISFTTASACPRKDSIEIEVFDILYPEIEVISPICSDTIELTLEANIAGGIWAGDLVVAGTIIIPSTANVGTHWLYYTVVNANNCQSIDSTTVDIVLAPIAEIDSFGPLCVNADDHLLDGGTAGGLWSGPGIADANTGLFSPSSAGDGIHELTYVVTNGGDCPRHDTVLIQVDPSYDPKIASAGPFCSNDEDALMNVSAEATGYWSGTGILDSITGNFSPSRAGAGTHTITYSIPGACNSSNSAPVLVHPQPEPVITGKEFFCTEEDTFRFSVDVPGGTWTGFGLSDDNDGLFTPSSVATGLYLLEYDVEVNGCYGYDSLELEVHEVSVTVPDVGKVCSKNPNNLYPIVAETEGDVTYLWNTGEITPAIAVNGGGDFTVTITDVSGCTAEATTHMIDDCNCHLWLPNAFTPNYDGLNDGFRAYGEAPINFNMRIYDRWGDKIFESNAMEDEWDGFYQGTMVQPDVYIVKIECDIGGKQIDKVTVER